jgi:hypothetical protein
MPFDPALPANNAPLNSAQIRTQLNALHAVVAPVGSIMAWLKNLAGVPALPGTWAECNGQTLDDPESPLHGQVLPALNTEQRFLRGAAISGGVGGIDYFGTASADNAGVGATFAAVTTDFSPGATPFPPYYEAVWIVRVK